MIRLWRSSTNTTLLRREDAAGYKLRTICESKACDYTVGYGFMRSASISSEADVPEMVNLYSRDTTCWNSIWPGSYDWPDAQQAINYIEDAAFHSHGYGSYVSESKMLLSQMYRNYAIPTGIITPPIQCRMWLQSCGQAIYHYRPELTPQSWYGAGVIGTNWSVSPAGLEMHFWSQTGTGTATYVLTHQQIYDKNVARGNTISVEGGAWPKWSGGIFSDNLPNVCPLFAEGNGVVCCRFRWVFPGSEAVSPICDYCSNAGYYSAPATKMKYASNPMLWVWG